MLAAAVSCARKAPAGPLPVIPAPNHVMTTGRIASRLARVNSEIRDDIAPEGYVIEASRYRINVKGGSEAGLYYGLQTLRQMKENGGVRTGIISDAPRYAWRGFMLDEARHFSGKERVKMILDHMAELKLNRFHWHLTDAQGWRIEIKAYPRLTEVGAIGTHSDPSAPAAFYTQDDIREIVAYAAERHITVVPEIDMPGHAAAANRSYPEFNGGGSATQPNFTFNPGKEGTYAYLTTILREVVALFPGEYLHLGGDEVNYGSEAWLGNPDVQTLMKREKLGTLKDVESYFLHRMADSVAVLGKTLICWDDAFDVGIGGVNQIIGWWRHDRPEKLVRAAKAGTPLIMCPRKPMYFDFVQHDSHNVGRKWDGFCPLEDVYAFPDSLYPVWGLDDEALESVVGIQANLWSELTHDTDRVDFMIFPRLYALAEAAWTVPDAKDYSSFEGRMERVYDELDKEEIYYYDPRDPARHPEPAGPNFNIVLANEDFTLELSPDGYALSLLAGGEECLEPDVRLPICEIMQERPYDNENFLMFPAKPRRFPAESIRRSGDTLFVTFKDTWDVAVIVADVRPHYIGFRLDRVDYRFDDKGVKRKTEIDALTLLQLPVKHREHFGEWMDVSWDDKTAVCLMGADEKVMVDDFAASLEHEVGLSSRGAILFAGSTDRLLDNIDLAERDFGMPRGVQSRFLPEYKYSYYELRDVTPENIDTHIEWARKGGFKTMVVYYPDFARTCGHFLWKDGWSMQTLRAITRKIEDAGLIPGLHIHYSKVSVDDPYVCSGMPDSRLNYVAERVLAGDLEPKDTEIAIDGSSEIFRNESGRRIVRIGDEFISYEAIGDGLLTGCERGLWNTKPVTHKAGERILQPDMDDWPRFIRIDQNSSLQDEIAARIADIYNQCGFGFVYYDGAEDVPLPYWYNVSRSQLRVHDKLEPAPLFSEGAIKSHYGWHILSRGNAFDLFKPEKLRAAMKQYTLRGAQMNADNFTAVDFGWMDYLAPSQTSTGMQPDHFSYVFSKALAYDSPVSVMGKLDQIAAHPRSKDNFAVMKAWEEAKNAGAFSPEIKEMLRDPDREWFIWEGKLYEWKLENEGPVRSYTFNMEGKPARVFWSVTDENIPMTVEILK